MKKIKDLNLENIKIGIELDTDIPEKFSEELIKDFNSRNFENDNINKIIKLCSFLKIKKGKKFLVENIVPSTTKLTKLKENYKYIFPSFMISTSEHDTDIHVPGLIKKVTELGLINWIKFYSRRADVCGEMVNSYWPKDRLYNIAIEHNQIEALKLVSKYPCFKAPTSRKLPWDFNSVKIAIFSPYTTLDTLKYMIDNGCNYKNDNLFEHLIKSKKIDFFEYFLLKEIFYEWHLDLILKEDNLPFFISIEKVKNNILPWDICVRASGNNSINILKYIISKNWFIEYDSAAQILYSKDLNFEEEYLNPLKVKMVQEAINKNNISILEYLYEDLKFDIKNMDLKHPNFFFSKCINYLRNHDIRIDESSMPSFSSTT